MPSKSFADVVDLIVERVFFLSIYMDKLQRLLVSLLINASGYMVLDTL